MYVEVNSPVTKEFFDFRLRCILEKIVGKCDLYQLILLLIIYSKKCKSATELLFSVDGGIIEGC
jgi:hypothetical protein